MKTKLLFGCILSLLLAVHSYAQPRCGFDVKMKEMRKQYPGFEKEINEQIRQYILSRASAPRSRVQAAVYYIPVVVHVIHTGTAIGDIDNPTDATIISAINYLNSVYDGTWTGSGGAILGVGDIQIKFVLATKDPNGNPTTGINRVNGSGIPNYSLSGVKLYTTGVSESAVKDLSRWDPERYYNVWIVNKIDGLDGTLPNTPFVAGYANYPMPNNILASDLKLDGIVMLATQMRSGEKTLPHEIGHAFNLAHVFEGEGDVPGGVNTCPINSNPVIDGDGCADTDPVINPMDDSYGGNAFLCRSGTNPCTGTPYNDNTEKNFMNYTLCYQLFTSDQKTRMLAAAVNSTRNSLATSWANNQNAYPTSWAAPAAAAVTPSTSGGYPNYLGIMNISLNGIKIYSLNATQDGGYVNNAKWYNLIQLVPNTNYTLQVGLNNSGNREQLGVWIDYDGNGVFNDVNERVYFNNNNPAANSASISFTTPATLSGNIVRMRIMNDFSIVYGGIGVTSLTGSTSSLVAGQAEDYPIFLKNTSVLPLKLVEFSGFTSNHTNYLKWKTLNETNTKEFEVQRSINGTDFESIGTIDAKGNPVSETSYQFIDDNQGSGTYVYRLKMVDMNDAFTYGNTVNLKIEDPANVEVLGNPFTNSIKLRIPQNVPVSLMLTDELGRTLVKKEVRQGQSSIVELPVNPNLSKGVYLLEARVNNVKTVYKLVKQ